MKDVWSDGSVLGSSPEADKCAWRQLEQCSKNPFAYSEGGQKLQQLGKEVREIRFLCMKWKPEDKPLAFIHTWATGKHGGDGTTLCECIQLVSMKKLTTAKHVLKYDTFLFRISTLISLIHVALLINVIKNCPITIEFFFFKGESLKSSHWGNQCAKSTKVQLTHCGIHHSFDCRSSVATRCCDLCSSSSPLI